MNWISEVTSPEQLLHGLGSIWSATRVANPACTTLGAVTFRAEASFDRLAATWHREIFAPALLPALQESLVCARQGLARELGGIDAALSRKLPPSACAVSISAGRRLAGLSDLRGDRVVTRLAARIVAEETPGHFAVVFAARCVAFSLPDRVAIGAYLFQEIAGGAPCAPVDQVCEFIAASLDASVSPELRAA